MYSIRPFIATDEAYEEISGLYRLLWPDERSLPGALWRSDDEEWPATALNRRFVLETGRKIVGYGACFERYWQHEAGTVHVDFHLHPDHVGEATTAHLYDFLIEFLSARTPPPKVIATDAREDRARRIAFLQARGFKPAMRSPRASLDLDTFNPDPFAALPRQLARRGIEIYSLSDVMRLDPGWKQKLYDLRWAPIQDVPAVESPTRPTLAQFEQMVLEDPALDEEAWFIAINKKGKAAADSGTFIGTSNLWLNDPNRRRLDTGLTGVRRAYRRRGIATALKVQAIFFARRIGARTIETSNEENNPMFTLNLKLGFRPKAAWVSYRKPFV